MANLTQLWLGVHIAMARGRSIDFSCQGSHGTVPPEHWRGEGWSPTIPAAPAAFMLLEDSVLGSGI